MWNTTQPESVPVGDVGGAVVAALSAPRCLPQEPVSCLCCFTLYLLILSSMHIHCFFCFAEVGIEETRPDNNARSSAALASLCRRPAASSRTGSSRDLSGGAERKGNLALHILRTCVRRCRWKEEEKENTWQNSISSLEAGKIAEKRKVRCVGALAYSWKK